MATMPDNTAGSIAIDGLTRLRCSRCGRALFDARFTGAIAVTCHRCKLNNVIVRTTEATAPVADYVPQVHEQDGGTAGDQGTISRGRRGLALRWPLLRQS